MGSTGSGLDKEEARCGRCSWFIRLRIDPEGLEEGECRLGCWPAPLKETASCANFKPFGSSFENALKRKRVAGAPRRYHDSVAPPQRRKPLPSEIDIDMDQDEFRTVIRQVLQEELGLSDSPLGDRWSGGELVLKPGRTDTQEKRIPLEAFFHKIVMVRDKLRVLEQKVNGHKGLSDADKVQLQQYITGCYGSLTTFNVLFANKSDAFSGQKKSD